MTVLPNVIACRVKDKPRICFVVSDPITARVFLLPHIVKLMEHYQVDVVQNGPEGLDLPEVNFHAIPIVRRVSPLRDLLAFALLIKLFKRNGYACVHTVTPKAGLLGTLAARVVSVPNRFHWFTGQVWATEKGIRRRVFKFLDWLIARSSTMNLVDGPSQAKFLVQEGVLSESKSEVLGHGSICGVDTERFKRNPEKRIRIRRELSIPDTSVVILFVGRLTREKGLLELAESISCLDAKVECTVLIVGFDEEALSKKLIELSGERHGDLRILGSTKVPEDFMSAADIYCMPSHREGFGLSVIEASASELPAVVSDVYGLKDAVVDGVTGLTFPSGNSAALARCLEYLATDDEFRRALGTSGRKRVLDLYRQTKLTDALLEFYRRQLESKSG